MDLKDIIIINMYSVIILLVLCFHGYKYSDKESYLNKLYRLIMYFAILMLIFDIFSRFDGRSDSIYPIINHFGNFMVFLLSPAIPSLWLLYVHQYIFRDKNRQKKMIIVLFTVNILNILLVIFSLSQRWFYYIDENNIYHRGDYFLFSAVITVILLLIAYFLTVVYREKVDKRQYYALLLFAVPPFVSIILQIAFYGVSLILNSVVLSILIVYLNIQNRNIYIDYLTGVYNRKKLEIVLRERINDTKENGFSAVMIDLNDFKEINDLLGHNTGDEALQNTAEILKRAVGSSGIVSRYGGDEFFIILDSSDEKDLKEMVIQIRKLADMFNESQNKQYKLNFGIGYGVYDRRLKLTSEAFQRRIDELMYEDKRLYRENKESIS